MKPAVQRASNKIYYRILHVPLWIWAFWILPGHLTADLYAHGPDRRHWTWLAIITVICAWRGFVGRLPGVEPRPYITHYGENKPNLWYRMVCYTTAWIDLLVPFTLNLAGLLINAAMGRWIISALYVKLYYLLAALVVMATLLDWTPRARRSTRNEGCEKAWFYVAVWSVVPTQIAGWIMWRSSHQLGLAGAKLDHARLLAFLIVAASFLALGLLGKLPRTQRYYLPEPAAPEEPLPAEI